MQPEWPAALPQAIAPPLPAFAGGAVAPEATPQRVAQAARPAEATVARIDRDIEGLVAQLNEHLRERAVLQGKHLDGSPYEQLEWS